MSEIDEFLDLNETEIHHNSIKEKDLPKESILFIFEDDDLVYLAKAKNILERIYRIGRRNVTGGPLSRLKRGSKLRMAIMMLPDPWGKHMGDLLANYYVLKFHPRMVKALPLETIEDLEKELRDLAKDLESEFEFPELEFFGE
jgi:hypothetical protein